MKKTTIAVIFLLVSLVTLLTSCFKTVEFEIKFIVDGEVYDTVKTNGKDAISMPNNPEKKGFTFDGWYWDEGDWQKPFTANSLLDAPLSSNMSVYAKWKSKESEHIHTPSEWIEDIPATCKAAGSKHKECIACHERLEEGTVEKLTTHTYDGGTDEGCNVCGEKREVCKHEELTTLEGRDYTCTENGLTEGKQCKSCGKITVKQNILPADHKPGDWIVDTEATSGASGLRIKRCTICDTIVDSETIPPLPEEEKCVLEYEVDQENTFVRIMGIGEFNEPHLIVPSTVEGLPVTEIYAQAFLNCDFLKSVTLPETLQTIGFEAFWRCTELESVTIPASVTEIGTNIFKDTPKLRTLNYNSSFGGEGENEFLKSSSVTKVIFGGKTVPDYILYDAANITSVEIKSSVETIGRYAFYYSGITEVKFSEGLTTIGNAAFFGCNNITSLNIPSTVTSIAASALSNCMNLASVELPSGLERISKSLFSGCNALKTVSIPDTVTEIDEFAFYNTGITSIVIPDGITVINMHTFENCYWLETITIPSNVTDIKGNAFYCCESLKTVYYNGVLEKWNKITIGGSNSPLLNAEIITQSCVSHVASEWITDVVAKCDMAGSRHKECTECGVVLEKETVTVSHVELVVEGTAPTCVDVGYSDSSFCSRCGKSIKESENIPSLGHTAGEWVTEAEPSDYSSGLKAKKCIRCNEMMQFESIPANIIGLNYELSIDLSSGQEYITIRNSYGTLNSTTLTIPDEIDGFLVCAIGDDAFGGYYNLKKVIIPDGIKSIGCRAFSNCVSLTYVSIGEDVNYIGANAFTGCSSLASVECKIIEGWWRSTSSTATDGTKVSGDVVIDGKRMSEYLCKTYDDYHYRRS